MRHLLIMALLIALTAGKSISALAAGGPPVQDGSATWEQRDTAAYVVSTLNLLRTRTGTSVSTTLTDDLNATRFDVYVDISTSKLYFIVAKQTDGLGIGVFVYQMGWFAPRAVSSSMQRLGVKRASRFQAQEYEVDPLQLIGSFPTTLPR